MIIPNASNLESHTVVNDVVHISADKSIGLLRITWQRQATSEELREGFYKAVELAILYGCKYWLSDARKTTYLAIGDQHFMIRDLVSLISSSTIEKVARLVNDDELSLLSAYNIRDKIEANHQVHINFVTEVFTDEEVAMVWLFT